jgi:hypothetical protein
MCQWPIAAGAGILIRGPEIAALCTEARRNTVAFPALAVETTGRGLL